MLHCCEAPRSMLSNYFCQKQVLRGTFGESWRIQIQIYPKTYVELKYGACYLHNKLSAHRLRLVVQLSWRVAPHYKGVYRTAPATLGLVIVSDSGLSICFPLLDLPSLSEGRHSKKKNVFLLDIVQKGGGGPTGIQKF